MKTNVLKILDPHSTMEDRFFSDFDDLKEIVDFYKSQGKKIVMTGGSWDMLHLGHVLYLQNARKRGDLLIVAVDSDNVVKKTKGPDRPVVSQAERIEVIAALRVADMIIMYDLDSVWNPENVVRSLCPHILVMSETTDKNAKGEFARKWQKAYEGVCEVVVLEEQATTTTSARVAQLVKEGGKKLGTEIMQVVKKHLGMDEDHVAHNGEEKKGGASS